MSHTAQTGFLFFSFFKHGLWTFKSGRVVCVFIYNLLLHSDCAVSAQMVTFAFCEEPQLNTAASESPSTSACTGTPCNREIAAAWAPHRTKTEREMNTSPNWSGKAERILGGREKEGHSFQKAKFSASGRCFPNLVYNSRNQQ